jgi:hypothetical protein
MRSTIVLVHGAFAESASWDGVIMAHRARSQRTVAIEGASHALPVSRPDATVHPILEAAALRAAV